MNIKYDEKVDAKYIRIKKGKIDYTKKETDWLLFDCAKNGEVLGVEILNASQNLVSLSTVDGQLSGYSLIQTNIFGNNELGFTITSPEFKKDNQFATV